MKTKYLNIVIPEDLHLFFKMYAVRNSTTMKDLIIEYVESLKIKKEGNIKTLENREE